MAESTPQQRMKLTQKIDGVRSDFKALKCLKAGAEDFLIKGEYTNMGLYRSVRYAIERHRVTYMFLPPTAIYMLLAEPGVRTADLSSLEYISYAGAPMSLDRLKEAIDILGPHPARIPSKTSADAIRATGRLHRLRPPPYRPSALRERADIPRNILRGDTGC